jgi:hypothetical protein
MTAHAEEMTMQASRFLASRLVAMFALSLLGSLLGWRTARKGTRRSLYDETPPDMSPEQHRGRLKLKRRMHRMVSAVLGASIGLLLSWAAFMLLGID